MNRFEQAAAYHHRGFNCCQAVLATYSDLTGLSEQASFDLGGGFGAGAQTGELCGAITGAVLTLGLLTPVDPEDPVGSKRRTGKLAKEFQKRFQHIRNLFCAFWEQNKRSMMTIQHVCAHAALTVRTHRNRKQKYMVGRT